MRRQHILLATAGVALLVIGSAAVVMQHSRGSAQAEDARAQRQVASQKLRAKLHNEAAGRKATLQTVQPSKPADPSPPTQPVVAATVPSLGAGEVGLGLSAASVAAGSEVTVAVYENSGGDAVNTVQVKLTYDASRLDYAGIAEQGDFSIVAATDTSTAGVIRLARATSGTAPTGLKTVASITFRTKTGISGRTDIGIDRSQSQLVSPQNGTADILKAVRGVSLQIQ